MIKMKMTTKKTNKKIKKSQKQTKLDSMTPAQKRVAIAKDVLKYLRAGKISAETKTLCDLPANVANVPEKIAYDDERLEDGPQAKYFQQDAAKLFRKAKACEVCAVGGLFYAALTRFNTVSLGDICTIGGGYDDELEVVWRLAKGYLKRFFAEDQIELIEKTFENTYGLYSGNFDNEDHDVIASYLQSIDRDDRLELVMENIVKNNGRFKPEHFLTDVLKYEQEEDERARLYYSSSNV